jgi:hypothetical protein
VQCSEGVVQCGCIPQSLRVSTSGGEHAHTTRVDEIPAMTQTNKTLISSDILPQCIYGHGMWYVVCGVTSE